ncbi:MAG: hypothetical protein HOW73_47520 [Polyangiaceae bacterium]|nr:hypothetical protein [Polyangiaceae bacterium]
MIGADYVWFRTVFATSSDRGTDGFLVFPGHDETFKPATSPDLSFPLAIDLKGSNDGSPYVDEYHWYLSDPSFPSGAPRLQLQRHDPSALASRSSRVRLALTAEGTAILDPQNSDNVDRLLRDVHLYAKRLSDNTIYWSDLHRCVFAPDAFVATATLF